MTSAVKVNKTYGLVENAMTSFGVFLWSEAVNQRFSVKKMFLKISQNSQENT